MPSPSSRQLEIRDFGFETSGREPRRWHVAQRRIRPVLVVVRRLPVDDPLHTAHSVEQMRVEHLLAERAVEPLDKRVLVGLARLDAQHALRLAQSVNLQAVNSGPLSKRMASRWR